MFTARAAAATLAFSPRVARQHSLAIFGALCTALALLGCEGTFLSPPQYASISVTATDSAGIGVPGLWLQLYTGERIIAYGVTDPNGSYLFTEVPPGGYGVLTVLPALYQDTDSPYQVIDNLSVAAGTIEPVHFAIGECRGVIDAKVTEVAGASAEGVNVLFYPDKGTGQVLQTNTTGAASLVVKCGAYGVRVDPTPGFSSPEGRNSSYVDGLAVHRDKHVNASLKVQSCFGALRVTVLDAANAPVPGALVDAYTSTSTIASGLTGVDGRYVLSHIACVDFGVVVSKAPAGYRVLEGRGNRFVDGLRIANNVTTDVTFHLAAP